MPRRDRARLAVAVVLALAVVAPGRSQPVTVQETAEGHGWEVRVSFAADPQTFARAGHAWTLEHAREVADVFQKTNAPHKGGLAVAALRIEGKDGDGTPRPGQGPRLPDWPIVEQQFRARTGPTAAPLDTRLGEVGKAYRAAAVATEALFRRPQPRPDAAGQRQIEQLYQGYNGQVDTLGRDFFKGQPPPLPRLKPLPPDGWQTHAANWADARKNQYEAEQLGRRVADKRADLGRAVTQQAAAVKQAIQSGQSLKSDLFGGQLEALRAQAEKDRQAEEKLKQAVRQQQSALDGKIVDASAVLPPANGFTSGKDGAAYVPSPRVMVYKTDDKGEPLPDDQQPPGYPKPYQEGAKLAAREAPVVHPNLRVMLLDQEPGNVQANVFGKVVDVDKDAGTLTVQVDERGTTLEYSGIDPQGVKEGDFLQPTTPIGRWRNPPPGRPTRELFIRAWSPSQQPVDPRSVLEFATYPPSAPNQLKRAIPPADATPLPVKGTMAPPPPGGRPGDRARLAYDETMEKSLTSGTVAKRAALDAKETIARGELKRKQDAAAAKETEAGALAAKLKVLDQELKQAEDNLKSLGKKKKDADDLDAKAKADKAALDAELQALMAEKARLDAEAKRLKGSANNAAIKAYNQEAIKHNERERAYRNKKQDQRDEQAKADQLHDELKGEPAKSQAKANALKAERGPLQQNLNAANAERDALRDQLPALQDALQAIADQRSKLNTPIPVPTVPMLP